MFHCFLLCLFNILFASNRLKKIRQYLKHLSYFVKYRVSALPVVDNQRKLVNIYSKFDVIVSDILIL